MWSPLTRDVHFINEKLKDFWPESWFSLEINRRESVQWNNLNEMQSKAHVSKAMNGRRTLNENDEFENWWLVFGVELLSEALEPVHRGENNCWTYLIISEIRGPLYQPVKDSQAECRPPVQQWAGWWPNNSPQVNVRSTTQSLFKVFTLLGG